VLFKFSCYLGAIECQWIEPRTRRMEVQMLGDHVQQMLYESNWRLQELYNPISQLPIKYFSVASRGKNIVVSFITIVNKSTYVFRFVLED